MLTNITKTIKYYELSEMEVLDVNFFKMITSNKNIKSVLKFMQDHPNYKLDKCLLSDLNIYATLCSVVNPVELMIKTYCGQNTEDSFELLDIINKRAHADLFTFEKDKMLYGKGESSYYEKIAKNNKDIFSLLFEQTAKCLSTTDDVVEIIRKKTDILFKHYEYLKFNSFSDDFLYNELFYVKDKSSTKRPCFEALTEIISSSEKDKNFIQLSLYSLTYNYTVLSDTQLKKFRNYIEKKDFFDYARVPSPLNLSEDMRSSIFNFLYESDRYEEINKIIDSNKHIYKIESFKENLCFRFLDLLKFYNMSEMESKIKTKLDFVEDFFKKHHSPENFKMIHGMTFDKMLTDVLLFDTAQKNKKTLVSLLNHYKSVIYPSIEKETLMKSLSNTEIKSTIRKRL